MLDKTIPAVVLPILYPGSSTPVRFHRHTDTGAIWVVAVDICNVLGLTNTSYVASKLPKNKVYKHLCYTDGGRQTVTWFELSAVYQLCVDEGNMEFLLWLRSTAINIPDSQEPKRVIKDPVIIERSTFNKLLSIFIDLNDQNLI